MLVPAGSPSFFLREHRFAVRCRVVTLRQLLWTLCMLLFMLSTCLLHIFLYIFFINIGCASCKCNSISPFYDVCNCFIICHLIITRILAAELNYRFTNSKTSLAIVIQYSLQEEESRNVSSELVHYNHKVLAIYTHWQTHWHTQPLPHQQSDGKYWALMIWKDDGNTLTVAHTAHVTWVRHHVTHHTLLHHLSLRWLARIKVNFTYFSLIKVNICQTVGVKHILNYK